MINKIKISNIIMLNLFLKCLYEFLPSKNSAHNLFRNMSVKQQKKQLKVEKGCLWRLEIKEGRGGDRCFSL